LFRSTRDYLTECSAVISMFVKCGDASLQDVDGFLRDVKSRFVNDLLPFPMSKIRCTDRADPGGEFGDKVRKRTVAFVKVARGYGIPCPLHEQVISFFHGRGISC